MRPVLFAALTLAFVGSAATADYATDRGPLNWNPDPPRAGEAWTVRLTPDAGPVANATLKVCYADKGKAVLCLLPKPMAPAGQDAFQATVPPGEVPADQEIGVNASWTDENGREFHWPEGDLPLDEAYVFVWSTKAERAAPGPVAALVLATVGVVAVLAHHNLDWGLRRLRR